MRHSYRVLVSLVSLSVALLLSACVVVTPVEQAEGREYGYSSAAASYATRAALWQEAWNHAGLSDFAAGRLTVMEGKLVDDLTWEEIVYLVQQHRATVMAEAWTKANLGAFYEGQLTPVEGKLVADLTYADYEALLQENEPHSN